MPVAYNKYHGSERRHSHRHRLKGISVRYKKPLLWVLHGRDSQPCKVSNIDSHGVRFYTYTKLKPRSVIEITFDVPVGVYRISGSNHLKAKVIWQKWSHTNGAWRTGAHFIHVSDAMHTDLSRMMKDAALHSSSF